MAARGALVIGLMAIVLGIPYLLRPSQVQYAPDVPIVAALSPHNESIRYEYEVAFSRWHRAHYGKPVRMDWRFIGGGTSDIVRYVAAEYVASFRAYWTGHLGRRWTPAIESGFANPRIDPTRPPPGTPQEVVEARRAFLESNVGIGIDLLFGGGWYDVDKQARMGNLVPCGLAREHPEMLRPEVMPQMVGGEVLYDTQDRYYGTCLTCFGICFNYDGLRRLGIDRPPSQWSDLADARFLGAIGLADPAKSGSSNKAFEMLIQQQVASEIRNRCRGLKVDRLGAEQEREAVEAGFWTGMRLIQRISGNARYFTNYAPKVAVDVAQGNSVAGMCIDFFGRFESGGALRQDGTRRMGYITPIGGSSVSMDPVAMFRGAPQAEIAKRFIYFSLTLEGQRLWSYRVGVPGGPTKYALHRPPIRRDLYTDAHKPWTVEDDTNPYDAASEFTYVPRWTAGLFDFIRIFIRAMCLDTHEELVAAWSDVLAAGGPDKCREAVALMERMPLTYEQAEKVNLRDKLKAVEVSREWTEFFRNSYKEARKRAIEKVAGR